MTENKIVSTKESILVLKEDGVLTPDFDNRMKELLEDWTVSNIVGPRIVCLESNAAGNWAALQYTIWYRKSQVAS